MAGKKTCWKMSAIMAGIVLLTCAVGLAAAENLVANPGFELDKDENGWPDDWNIVNTKWAGSQGTVDWDTAVKHSGKGSLRIIQTNDKGNMQVKTLPITVKPGAKYYFSGWLKAEFEEAGNHSSYFFLTGYKDGKMVRGLESRSNTPEIRTTTDWKQYKRNFRFADNIDTVTITAIIIPGPGTIWIDDIVLDTKPVPAVPPPAAKPPPVKAQPAPVGKNPIRPYWRNTTQATHAELGIGTRREAL